MFQSLNVGVFEPLTTGYKQGLKKFTKFTTFNVDKTDFIEILMQARKETISSKNIQTVWKTTGFISFNPSKVISKLIDKSNEILFTSGPSTIIIFIINVISTGIM